MTTRINFSSLFSVLIPVIHSLRDVRVKVPSAVRKSDTVVLHCYYDMEGDSLYSVKWYKGQSLVICKRDSCEVFFTGFSDDNLGDYF